MLWARLLAYVTGTVNQELLLRNEYLTAENRILKGQIKGRVLLTEGEKETLAEIAHRLPWIWALVVLGIEVDTLFGCTVAGNCIVRGGRGHITLGPPRTYSSWVFDDTRSGNFHSLRRQSSAILDFLGVAVFSRGSRLTGQKGQVRNARNHQTDIERFTAAVASHYTLSRLQGKVLDTLQLSSAVSAIGGRRPRSGHPGKPKAAKPG